MVLFNAMPLRSFTAISAFILSVSATLWAGPFPDPDAMETPVAADAPIASVPEDAGEGSNLLQADLLQTVKPAAAPEETESRSNGFERTRAGLVPQSEYAPLALFSLGSLVVGGAFYAINASSRGPNVTRTADGRSSLANAAGVAGLTALLAAGSYLYFSRHGAEPGSDAESEPQSDWDARVSGGVAPDGEGGMAVGALVTLPLSSLSR